MVMFHSYVSLPKGTVEVAELKSLVDEKMVLPSKSQDPKLHHPVHHTSQMILHVFGVHMAVGQNLVPL